MDPKTGIHEPTVILVAGYDYRAKWTQKQIDRIDCDAKKILAKLRPLPTVEHLSKDADNAERN